jgi:predicted  nucleic acid-binding Zn-ribbon protein
MFTTQATIERRAAKEHRLADIEERLSAVVNDVEGLKHFRVAAEEQFVRMEKCITTMETTVSDVSCSVTRLNERIDSVEAKNDERIEARDTARHIQGLNSRIDDVLQRMVELKADIDKLTPAPSSSSKFGGGGGSKFAIPSKKNSKADNDDN